MLLAVLPGAPESYVHHDRLVVDGEEVPWWYADETVHASDVFGLARGAAWACGRWGDRLLADSSTNDGSVPQVLQMMNGSVGKLVADARSAAIHVVALAVGGSGPVR